MTRDEERLLLLACSQKDIAGYLRAGIVSGRGLFHERYAFNSDAFVRSECRSQGLGCLLLRRAEQWCGEQGVSDLRLEAFSDNKPAVRFWTPAVFELESLAMRKSVDDGP